MDRVWRSFDIKLHASDQIVLNEHFHISEVVMGESAMPERQVEWESGSWVRKLCNRLSHTIQECSVVIIDGGDEQWWSTRSSERLENSTALPFFPSRFGWNTTDPTPAE